MVSSKCQPMVLLNQNFSKNKHLQHQLGIDSNSFSSFANLAAAAHWNNNPCHLEAQTKWQTNLLPKVSLSFCDPGCLPCTLWLGMCSSVCVFFLILVEKYSLGVLTANKKHTCKINQVAVGHPIFP